MDTTPVTVYIEVPIIIKERACWELQPSRPTSPADQPAQQTDSQQKGPTAQQTD